MADAYETVAARRQNRPGLADCTQSNRASMSKDYSVANAALPGPSLDPGLAAGRTSVPRIRDAPNPFSCPRPWVSLHFIHVCFNCQSGHLELFISGPLIAASGTSLDPSRAHSTSLCPSVYVTADGDFDLLKPQASRTRFSTSARYYLDPTETRSAAPRPSLSTQQLAQETRTDRFHYRRQTLL